MQKLKAWWSLLTFRWRFFKQNLELAASVTPQMLAEPIVSATRQMKIRMSIAMQPKVYHPVCVIQQVFEITIASPEPEYIKSIISSIASQDTVMQAPGLYHPVIKNAVMLTLEELVTNKLFSEVLITSFSNPPMDGTVLEFFSDYDPVLIRDVKKLRVFTALSDVS
jgi:hypothetical protein